MADRTTAGALLRQARTGASLSQAELAERSGTSQSVISVYESGRRQPSLPTLSALIEATGTTLDIHLDSGTGPQQALAAQVHAHAPEIDDAAKRHGVRVLGVFGSVARGEDHSGSDVDLLLDVPEGVGLFELGRLEAELRELVGATIDLVPEAVIRTRDRLAHRYFDTLHSIVEHTVKYDFAELKAAITRLIPRAEGPNLSMS